MYWSGFLLYHSKRKFGPKIARPNLVVLFLAKTSFLAEFYREKSENVGAFVGLCHIYIYIYIYISLSLPPSRSLPPSLSLLPSLSRMPTLSLSLSQSIPSFPPTLYGIESGLSIFSIYIYIYIYICCRAKIGPKITVDWVKHWSKFSFFPFWFSKVFFFLQGEWDFLEDKHTIVESNTGPIMLRNMLGPMCDSTLDQFIT